MPDSLICAGSLYVFSSHEAISLRTSVSDLNVSSNPGVSIRMISNFSYVNLYGVTSAVPGLISG